MSKILIIGIVIALLTGCGRRNSENTETYVGQELGWDGHLYKLVSIDSKEVGIKLGQASYHGHISGLFKIYKLDGTDPNVAVIFKSSDGVYLKGIKQN